MVAIHWPVVAAFVLWIGLVGCVPSGPLQDSGAGPSDDELLRDGGRRDAGEVDSGSGADAGYLDASVEDVDRDAGTDAGGPRDGGACRTAWTSFEVFTGGGSGTKTASAIATADGQSLLVTGSYAGEAPSIGHGLTERALPASAGLFDAYVARFSSGGVPEWVATLQGDGIEQTNDILSFSDGSVIVVGQLQADLFPFASPAPRTLTVGGGPSMVELTATYDGYGLFVLRLDPDGTPAWIRVVVSSPSTFIGAASAATSAEGVGVVVGGWFGGAVVLDEGLPSETVLDAGAFAEQPFLARYSDEGVLQWASALGGDGRVTSVATSGDGFGVAGRFFGSITLATGGSPLTLGGYGESDLFVAKINGAGQAIWAKAFGGGGAETGHSVVGASDGGMLVSASSTSPDEFTTPIDGEGDGPSISTGPLGHFMVELSPTGNVGAVFSVAAAQAPSTRVLPLSGSTFVLGATLAGALVRTIGSSDGVRTVAHAPGLAWSADLERTESGGIIAAGYFEAESGPLELELHPELAQAAGPQFLDSLAGELDLFVWRIGRAVVCE